MSVAELEKRVRHLERSNATLITNNEVLNETIELMEQQQQVPTGEVNQHLEEEISALETEVAELENEAAENNALLEKERAARKTLESKLAQAEANTLEAGGHVSAELDRLREDVEAWKKKCRELTKERDRIEAELRGQSQDVLSKQTTQLDVCQETIQQQEEELRSLRGVVDSQDDEIRTLRRSLSQLEDEDRERAMALEEAQMEAATALKECKTLQESKAHDVAEMDKLKAAQASLERDLGFTKQAEAQLQAQLASVEAKNQDRLEDEAAYVRDQQDQLAELKKLQRLQQQKLMRRHEGEVARLRSEIEELRLKDCCSVETCPRASECEDLARTLAAVREEGSDALRACREEFQQEVDRLEGKVHDLQAEGAREQTRSGRESMLEEELAHVRSRESEAQREVGRLEGRLLALRENGGEVREEVARARQREQEALRSAERAFEHTAQLKQELAAVQLQTEFFKSEISRDSRSSLSASAQRVRELESECDRLARKVELHAEQQQHYRAMKERLEHQRDAALAECANLKDRSASSRAKVHFSLPGGGDTPPEEEALANALRNCARLEDMLDVADREADERESMWREKFAQLQRRDEDAGVDLESARDAAEAAEREAQEARAEAAAALGEVEELREEAEVARAEAAEARSAAEAARRASEESLEAAAEAEERANSATKELQRAEEQVFHLRENMTQLMLSERERAERLHEQEMRAERHESQQLRTELARLKATETPANDLCDIVHVLAKYGVIDDVSTVSSASAPSAVAVLIQLIDLVALYETGRRKTSHRTEQDWRSISRSLSIVRGARASSPLVSAGVPHRSVAKVYSNAHLNESTTHRSALKSSSSYNTRGEEGANNGRGEKGDTNVTPGHVMKSGGALRRSALRSCTKADVDTPAAWETPSRTFLSMDQNDDLTYRPPYNPIRSVRKLPGPRSGSNPISPPAPRKSFFERFECAKHLADAPAANKENVETSSRPRILK